MSRASTYGLESRYFLCPRRLANPTKLHRNETFYCTGEPATMMHTCRAMEWYGRGIGTSHQVCLTLPCTFCVLSPSPLRTVAMSIIPFIVQVTRNHDAQRQGDGLVWQRYRDISPGLSDTAMHFLCALPLPFEDRGYVNHSFYSTGDPQP